MEVGGEAQDRADRDQEDASGKGHVSSPLKDAAEEIDGEQDQDDDDENSDDGQDELLGWVLASWVVKIGGTGAYSGDLERAFLPAEWLLSAAR